MQAARYGEMKVRIYDSVNSLGAAAAEDLAEVLRSAVAEIGQTAVILATGNSQLSFMRSLCGRSDVPWHRIAVFHMDEYLGMSDCHTASFRRYIRQELTDVVRPREFYGIEGDAMDVEAEMARYAALLEEEKPVACVLGIGENGHLAFNDPPADFDTARTIHRVALAEEARRQQVGEGHFPSLEDVPRHAITLTVPALLKASRVLAVVPEARKAQAVQAALEGPVTPWCPASILRSLSHVRLYLDRDSAALLRL